MCMLRLLTSQVTRHIGRLAITSRIRLVRFDIPDDAQGRKMARTRLHHGTQYVLLEQYASIQLYTSVQCSMHSSYELVVCIVRILLLDQYQSSTSCIWIEFANYTPRSIRSMHTSSYPYYLEYQLLQQYLVCILHTTLHVRARRVATSQCQSSTRVCVYRRYGRSK